MNENAEDSYMTEEIEFKEEDRAQNRTVRLRMLLAAVVSLPKTLWFNFTYLPFPLACKLPILVAYNVKVIEMHKKLIVINGKVSRFMIKIGFAGSDSIAERKSSICFEKGLVVFNGKASFSKGVNIRNSGYLSFGKNFYANKNCTIWSSNSIIFGSDVLLGWNITFRDSDGHMIIVDNKPHDVNGTISVGDHTWICSECHVLKNGAIGSECVLGYGSLLTMKYSENNVLIAGWPAKIVRNKVKWLRGK